jgi:hypothetical protein
MDIGNQTELLLRNAGYDTWALKLPQASVTCFESRSVAGFLFIFSSGTELLSEWESRQRFVLARFAPLLRNAGAKAWNIYSIFLAESAAALEQRLIAEIEENFSLTRKIARANLRTQDDIERALLPLRPIQSQPKIGAVDFEGRVREQLLLFRDPTTKAFFGTAEPASVAQMLEEGAW